jgi:hypothetical protein
MWAAPTSAYSAVADGGARAKALNDDVGPLLFDRVRVDGPDDRDDSSVVSCAVDAPTLSSAIAGSQPLAVAQGARRRPDPHQGPGPRMHTRGPAAARAGSGAHAGRRGPDGARAPTRWAR